MAYKGKYKVRAPYKYKGNPTKVIYRSLWELKFMTYCDTNINILEWGSEEMYVWYKSPVDNKPHRYFPDFYIKARESNGQVKKYIIEVKPQRQTKPPAKPKRQTRGYIREAYEYAKNKAKWKAANEWCLDRGFEFKILTEKELGIK
tara:strand:+ start:43 stop:480 length:438 start_codon:yes stop_codon:yes gene_type:complete